jgi:hypothetical protein
MAQYCFSKGWDPTAWGNAASVLIHGISISGSNPHTILRAGTPPSVFQPPLGPLMVTTATKIELEKLNLNGLEFQPVELVNLNESIEWEEWDRLDSDALSNLDAEQLSLARWMLDEHEERRSWVTDEIEIWAAISSNSIGLETLNDGEMEWTGGRVKIGRQPTKCICDFSRVEGFDFSVSNDHYPIPVLSQKCVDAMDHLGDGFIMYTEIFPQ